MSSGERTKVSVSRALVSFFVLLFPLLIHTAEPEPIDTLPFGLISMGMSESEVQRRLAPPAGVLDDAKTYVKVRTSQGTTEFPRRGSVADPAPTPNTGLLAPREARNLGNG